MTLQEPSNKFAIPFAANGDKNTIPEEQEAADGSASLDTGFPPETQKRIANGGVAPSRKDFNGILNQLSTYSFFQQSGGIFEWSEDLDYLPLCFVQYDGDYYIAQKQSGPNSSISAAMIPSEDDGTYWQPLSKFLGVEDLAGIQIGSGVPSSSLGNDGDVYFRTDLGNVVIYLKSSGAWSKVFESLQFRFGSGAPSSSLGNEGDVYLDTLTTANAFYLKTDGEWVLEKSITDISGNAATATKLATARTIRTDLTSTSVASFNGTANITPGVTGVLPIANGGTGNTTGAATTLGTTTVGGTAKGIYLNAGTATAMSATVGSGTNPVYLSSGTVTASTSTVGSGTKPIYLSSGTLTASSSTVGGTAKPVYLNSGTVTALSSTVGSGTKPVYMSSGTITASSSTVGTSTKPIYMSSGTLTASSSTVGSGTKPIYMSSGTLTASSSTVGDSSTPIYLKAGVLTKCSEINEYSSLSISNPGYIVLNSGLVIQWNSVLVSDVTSATYVSSVSTTFGMAFPTACLSIVCSVLGTDSGLSYGDSTSIVAARSVGVTSVSKTGATFGVGEVSTADTTRFFSNQSICYIAIGY